jgi:hypothetical protein
MMPARCPYCDTPLIGRETTCRNHLCIQAQAELVRSMIAGDQGDLEGWRQHHRRQQALIAEREKQQRREQR